MVQVCKIAIMVLLLADDISLKMEEKRTRKRKKYAALTFLEK